MGNKLAENLGVSGLWIAKVHHLIKELVDDDKIVADTLLADLTKVLLQRFNELVKEEKRHGSSHIAISDCKDCEGMWKERKRKRGKMKMGMVMRE